MTAFAASIRMIFADPNMAINVQWLRGGSGSPATVRGIRKAPDQATAFGGAQVWSETVLLDVMVEQVPDPAIGDHLVIAGESFVVQSEPMRDRERLVWTLDLGPL